jgi:hypothetical protein
VRVCGSEVVLIVLGLVLVLMLLLVMAGGEVVWCGRVLCPFGVVCVVWRAVVWQSNNRCCNRVLSSKLSACDEVVGSCWGHPL